jgi:hypothetical protein
VGWGRVATRRCPHAALSRVGRRPIVRWNAQRVATSAATSRSSIAFIPSRFPDDLDVLDASDVSDTRVTRLRAWSGITGWRFESSSAHTKAPRLQGFRRLRVAACREPREQIRGNIRGPVRSSVVRPAYAARVGRTYWIRGFGRFARAAHRRDTAPPIGLSLLREQVARGPRRPT